MREYICEGAECSVKCCRSRAVAKGFCNIHYQANRRYGHPLSRMRPPKGSGICAIDGCGDPPRSRGATYCEKHYMRIRRRGSPEKLKPPLVREHSNGYILEYAPSHPMSAKTQKVRAYQHRKVFYDSYGDGPFSCHVCSAPLTWDTMHVDHLDDDRKNNAVENLKPACPTCNRWRGKNKMASTQRLKAPQILAFGESKCAAEWSREFGVPATTLKRRIIDGWDAEKAIATPSGPTGKKSR